MSGSRTVWLIENNTGPRPVYFTLRLQEGSPVCTTEPRTAAMFNSAERARAYIEEFQLSKNWRAIECGLGTQN